MIKLRKIAKFYAAGGTCTHVLRGVDIDTSEGECVSIMGPSGAGKSTLLNIIGMPDEASEGAYFFLGHPVHELNEKKRAALYREYLGFVFQSYHLMDDLTVYENPEAPWLCKKVKSARRKSIVCDTLAVFK